MLVRDFAETPMPRLSVIRNQPEGVSQAAAPKSRKTRHIPLPDAVLPPIRRFASGKKPDGLLFTPPPAAPNSTDPDSSRASTRRSPAAGDPCTISVTQRHANGSSKACP
jgi:hypothetical protein